MKPQQNDKAAEIMLKLIAQAENDIKHGRVKPHEEVMSRLEKKLLRKLRQKKNKGTHQ